MTTQTLWIKAEAKQPLLLSQHVNGSNNILTSMPYIPGSTLRGAFAEAWLKRHPGDQDIRFQKVFVAERAVFSNLYPVSKQAVASPSPAFGPIPQTAMSCKRFPGFGDTNEKHGVSDYLFRGCANTKETYRNHFKKCSHQFNTDSGTEHTIQCNTGLHNFSGYMESTSGQQRATNQVCSKRSLYTRSGVNSMIESVQTGLLYSLEVLEEGSMFFGSIKIHDDIDTSPLESISMLRVGTGNTRGMGKIGITLLNEASFLSPISLKNRLENLQEKARAAGLPVQEGSYWVTLNCHSQVILSDPWMRSRLEIYETDLESYGNDVKWKIENQMTRSVGIGGWNSLLGLPKEERMALAAGGVVLARAVGEKEAVIDALTALEQYGLGERLGEGFGQIIACHPFHIDFFPTFE